MNNSPLIIADNLTCRFGSTLAVDHLSLSILPGHIVGLLGPNGAGKTTTLRMLLGLIPADTGSSSLLGCPSMKLRPEIKERIGYVPEDDALYGWKSAKGMLDFHGQFYPCYTKEYGATLLKRFDIPPKTLVSRLSKGLRRRLSVICALAVKPDILIMDEPASGFDPAARRMLMELLAEFIREGDRSVLISTHILTDVERVADEIAIIRGSRLLLHTDLDSLREHCRIMLFDSPVDREKIAATCTVLKYTDDGRTVEAVVSGYHEDHGLPVREVYPMNLEEIFLHLVQNGQES